MSQRLSNEDLVELRQIVEHGNPPWQLGRQMVRVADVLAELFARGAERDQATAYAAAARIEFENVLRARVWYENDTGGLEEAEYRAREILSAPTPISVAEHLQRVEALERAMERVRHLAKNWSRFGISEMAGTLKDIVNEHDQAVVRAAVVATEPTERGAGEESK